MKACIAVQGNLEDMLEDCNTGIAWVLTHIGSRGGDPGRVYMVGQSAGGQLGALALIAQVRGAALPALSGCGDGPISLKTGFTAAAEHYWCRELARSLAITHHTCTLCLRGCTVCKMASGTWAC